MCFSNVIGSVVGFDCLFEIGRPYLHFRITSYVDDVVPIDLLRSVLLVLSRHSSTLFKI